MTVSIMRDRNGQIIEIGEGSFSMLCKIVKSHEEHGMVIIDEVELIQASYSENYRDRQDK